MGGAVTFLLVAGDPQRLSSGWSEVVTALVASGIRVELSYDDRLDPSELIGAGAVARPIPLGRGAPGPVASAVLLGTRAAEHRPVLIHSLDPPLAPFLVGALAAAPGAQGMFSLSGDATAGGRLGSASLRAWVARNPARSSALLLDRGARSHAHALGFGAERVYELPAELGADADGLALDDDPAELRAASRRRLGLGADDVVVAMALSAGAERAAKAVIGAVGMLRAVRPAWRPVVLLRHGGLAARGALERAGAQVLASIVDRALLWHAADVLWLAAAGEHEALLEAALGRTPAVVPALGAYVDVVRDGETGWVRAETAAQCAQVVEVCGDGLARAAAGAAARSRALRGWDRGLCVERLLRVYYAVLTGETERARLDPAAGRIVAETGTERRRRELVGRPRPSGARE